MGAWVLCGGGLVALVFLHLITREISLAYKVHRSCLTTSNPAYRPLTRREIRRLGWEHRYADFDED